MDNRLVGVRTLRQSKVIFTLLFTVLLLGFSQEKAPSFYASKIPDKDKERISYFFKHAIFWDTYGYVLFGSKPCAITSYKRITWNPITWLEYFSPHNLKMKRGWNTWKKYDSLFPHPKFLFLEEDSQITSAHFIILIHRDAFLKTVESNQKDFDSVLLHTHYGKSLLVANIGNSFLSQTLQNHDGLIGTILGYGRNNAWAFHSKSKNLSSFLNEEEQSQMKAFCQQQGSWRFFMGTSYKELSHLPLPGFAADPNDIETEKLREIYSKSRNQIIDYYSSHDFLEATLQLLCKPTEP